MVQSHSATRQTRDDVQAFTPLLLVIGPVIRTNPLDVAALDTAGAELLAVTAPLSSIVPLAELYAPYAVEFVPPVVVPPTVIVPDDVRKSFYEFGKLRNPNVKEGTVKDLISTSTIPILIDTSLISN